MPRSHERVEIFFMSLVDWGLIRTFKNGSDEKQYVICKMIDSSIQRGLGSMEVK